MIADAPLATQVLVDKYKRFCDFITAIGKGVKSRRPSEKQYAFVSKYLETFDVREAYNHAGYMDLTGPNGTVNWGWERTTHNRVLQSQSVQYLIKLALFDWMRKHEVNAKTIADRLLHIADTAEKHADQIAALKELNLMLGYHKPQRRRKLSLSAVQQKAEKHAA